MPLIAESKLLSPGRMKLAVVGAHLSGMPLNYQLVEKAASLVCATKTAPLYRLFALPGTVPPKPGLLRVDASLGVAIELEIWELGAVEFAEFVAAIPSPLGIGSIMMDDGSAIQGFVCESFATAGADDISHFGGWRAYVRSLASP